MNERGKFGKNIATHPRVQQPHTHTNTQVERKGDTIVPAVLSSSPSPPTPLHQHQCSSSSAIYDRRSSRHLVCVSKFSFIFAPKRTEATKKCTRNHLIESLTGSRTHTHTRKPSHDLLTTCEFFWWNFTIFNHFSPANSSLLIFSAFDFLFSFSSFCVCVLNLLPFLDLRAATFRHILTH